MTRGHDKTQIDFGCDDDSIKNANFGLSFKEHLQNTCKTTNQKLSDLSTLSPYTTTEQRAQLINTFLKSGLYCNSLN